MAKVVDTLYIALGIDASKLDQGLATAQSKLAVGLKGMMSKVFAPLLAGASLSFGVLLPGCRQDGRTLYPGNSGRLYRGFPHLAHAEKGSVFFEF